MLHASAGDPHESPDARTRRPLEGRPEESPGTRTDADAAKQRNNTVELRVARREQPVEIHVHADGPPHEPQQPQAMPQSSAGEGWRWFWRILAFLVFAAVVIGGIALLSGVHQLVVGQAAQTQAINRQTSTLNGISAQLAGIRAALDQIAAELGQGIRALSHLGG